FVSVQRGLFRAPLEDPGASVRVHDLAIDAGRIAPVQVEGHRPPPPPSLATADRVVVAGARIGSPEELALVRRLAERLDAVFAVTLGIVERGFAKTDNIVGAGYHHVAPRLLVTVGVRGALDFLQAIEGNPTICAVGCDPGDPIGKRAAYIVAGEVRETVESVLGAL
ncbi:MAG: FAD-binding protein, partial [Halobacteriales archaeon]|nr:FAD-binding protein [Halobacteriales archaeon]